jgi:hypothetical protein
METRYLSDGNVGENLCIQLPFPAVDALDIPTELRVIRNFAMVAI